MAGGAAGGVLRYDPEHAAATHRRARRQSDSAGLRRRWRVGRRRRAGDAHRPGDRLAAARGRRRRRGLCPRRLRYGGVGRESVDRDRVARGSGARRRGEDLHARGRRRAGRAGRRRRWGLGREPAGPDGGAHRPRADRREGVPHRPRPARAGGGGWAPVGGRRRNGCRPARRHAARRLRGGGGRVRAGLLRPGHVGSHLGVAGAQRHERRPDHVPAGRRRCGRDAPAQPRRVAAQGVGWRAHVRVHAASGRALLDRAACAPERREARHRALAAHRVAAVRSAERHRVHHARRRQRDDRVPARAPGPGLPLPPRDPVRFSGATRDAAAARDRGGDRALPDRGVRAAGNGSGSSATASTARGPRSRGRTATRT